MTRLFLLLAALALLAAQTAPDDAAKQLAALQKRVEALERRLAAVPPQLPGGSPALETKRRLRHNWRGVRHKSDGPVAAARFLAPDRAYCYAGRRSRCLCHLERSAGSASRPAVTADPSLCSG